MAFGSFENKNDSEAINEINMIPFIDIMLVLLIIFIVTAPLLTHAVKINLPKISSAPNIEKIEKVEVAVLADGKIVVNGVETARDGFVETLKGLSGATTQIQLKADREAKYDNIAFVMTEAAKAGLSNIAFVTEPKN